MAVMAFRNIVILMAVGFLLIENFADAVCPEAEGDPSTEMRLTRRFFCDGYRDIRPPVQHNAYTRIRIGLTLNHLRYDDSIGVLEVRGLLHMLWEDKTFTWNKTDYDNIYQLTVPRDTVWLPDLNIQVLSDDELTNRKFSHAPCWVYNTGDVLCAAMIKQTAACKADVRRWPFDIHTCNLTIQSRGKAARLNVSTLFDGISDYYPGHGLSRGWDLLNATSVLGYNARNETPGAQASKMTFSFTLKRESEKGAKGVFVPAIVLAVLTWLTFLLESRSFERISVICVNILCHCAYLVHISSRIPPNGDSIPLILLFYRDSLIMAVASLIITLVVRKMDATSCPPPIWITGVVNGVLATLPGQMLLLRDVDFKGVAAVVDVENAEGSGQTRWHLFGLFVNYLTLFTCVVTTFVRIIMFLM